MQETDLSSFDNSRYKPGSSFKKLVWYLINLIIIKNPYFIFIGPKVFLLRAFGAKIGKQVVIKPAVNIKYPWFLSIGDNTWIGEGVWIDNLDQINIGSNCCVSQGALLLSGNHNYKRSSFDLILKPITLEDGVWIGANSVVTQGVRCKSHSLLAVGSVASSNLEPYTIYRGNPAIPVKERIIKS